MVRIIVVDDLIIFLHCLGIYVCTKHLAAPCGTLSSGIYRTLSLIGLGGYVG